MLIGTAVEIRRLADLSPAALDEAIGGLERAKREIEGRRDGIVRALGAVHDELESISERLDEARVLRATRSPEMASWSTALAEPVEAP